MKGTDHVASAARRFGRNMLHGPHGKYADHAPGLHKWWKAHVRINGQIIEHISPYQQKVVSPMFKDPFGKAKHKILDNWHWWPAAAGLWAFVNWSSHKYHDLERQEWP